MSRFGHKSNAEIAEQQGISVKTVEAHITQSLKILRRSLSDYLYFLLIIWCESLVKSSQLPLQIRLDVVN